MSANGVTTSNIPRADSADVATEGHSFNQVSEDDFSKAEPKMYTYFSNGVSWTGPSPGSSSKRPVADCVSPTTVAKLKGSATVFQPRQDVVNALTVADLDGDRDETGDEAPLSLSLSTNDDHNWKAATHYVKIDGAMPTDLFFDNYKSLTEGYQYMTKIVEQKIPKDSTINDSKKTLYLCLDDITDCHAIQHDAQLISEHWVLTFINADEYDSIEAHSKQNGSIVDRFDGQANVQAVCPGVTAPSSLSHDEISTLEEEVHKLAIGFGKVYALQQMLNSDVVEFYVEFCKFSDAKEFVACVTTAQPARFESWSLVASKLSTVPATGGEESTCPSTPHRATVRAQTHFCSPTGRSGWTVDREGKETPVKVNHPAFAIANRMAGTPQQYLSPPSRDRGDPRFWSAPIFPTATAFDAMDQSLGLSSRAASFSVNTYRAIDTEPQQVHTEKIENGTDVRTTIMLRNLPNRWNIDNLKTALDLTSVGKYDFSYLRIDFAYNTNVGYAFVNFIDPIHIVSFVNHWVGREWSPRAGGPRKIAQVSYATVQGYDCLVEKFRNSAIMDEYPGFRPKLWWTTENAPSKMSVGTERPFPGPNNFSKKQRSADNAGSIGLYAPRSAQRVGDRVHRSHWDRGTTRQIQEDAAFYNQYAPYYSGYAVQPPIAPPPPPFYGNQYYGQYPAYSPTHVGFGGGFNVYGQAPPAFLPAGGYQYPPAPLNSFSTGYTPVNPASGLRTMSNGRLAGRPRNVTVQPGNENLFNGADHDNAVPRSLGSLGGHQETEDGGDFTSTVRAHVEHGMPYPQQ